MPPSCARHWPAVSGRWYSPYDGATWTAASDVGIDHVVPLAEAWRSGASSWTTSRCQSFANDLTHPQLIAVSPTTSTRPRRTRPVHLATAAVVVPVYLQQNVDHGEVHFWGLSLQSAEKSALQSMLNTCAC